MKIISQIPYKGIDINILEEKEYVGYSFGFEGKNYGTKTLLQSKKRIHLIEAVMTLIISAIQSYENLSNKPARKGTTRNKPVSSNKRKSK
jgi:hypothetical protein